MTTERAIEILNPEHREHYESIEIVEEACRMGMAALEKQTPKKPHHNKDSGLYLCPNCENLKAYDISDFGNYCELCGQALDRS
ncbi:MAG: hypothetical protein K2L37_06600 [Lactobacillus sp.]|nr:hypothetical protein [Lactobacillus sp.]